VSEASTCACDQYSFHLFLASSLDLLSAFDEPQWRLVVSQWHSTMAAPRLGSYCTV
jgi:hypothetical protein